MLLIYIHVLFWVSRINEHDGEEEAGVTCDGWHAACFKMSLAVRVSLPVIEDFTEQET